MTTLVAACIGGDADSAGLELLDSQRDNEDEPLYAAASLRWSTRTIPVCFEGAPYADAQERAWVEDAARSSWDRVTALDFTGFRPCEPGARGLRIRVEDTGPYTTGLGVELDGREGGVVLNFRFERWSPDCQRTREHCIRAGAIHELGHALGFAHEQNRPDTPSWCSAEQGRPGDTPIGPWDQGSIMNYCNPIWTGDGQLSRMDVLAAQAVYGAPPGDWVVARSEGRALGDPHLGAAGHGAGATMVALEDVDGDHRADAVAYFEGGGRWWVASGTSDATFLPYRFAREGHGGSGAIALLGDVTGDGMADAVTYYPAPGSLWVAPSNGVGFGPDTLWLSGLGPTGVRVLLADADGDGRADLITQDERTGTWQLARSRIGGFASLEVILHSHGKGATDVFAADVDGDRRADLIAFFEAAGAWWIARASSDGFTNPSLFTLSHGIGSTARRMGDLDGDGRADALVYARGAGRWWVALSQGDRFARDAFVRGDLGITVAGGMVSPLFGDVNGDRRADAVIVWP